MAFMLCHLPFPLVKHLDIATQGDCRYDVFGTIHLAPTLPQAFAKADGEAQHLDPALARHPEVAKLMHGDEDRDHDEEGEQSYEQGDHWVSLTRPSATRRASASMASS